MYFVAIYVVFTGAAGIFSFHDRNITLSGAASTYRRADASLHVLPANVWHALIF